VSWKLGTFQILMIHLANWDNYSGFWVANVLELFLSFWG
jgi:hypothetical protein